MKHIHSLATILGTPKLWLHVHLLVILSAVPTIYKHFVVMQLLIALLFNSLTATLCHNSKRGSVFSYSCAEAS